FGVRRCARAACDARTLEGPAVQDARSAALLGASAIGVAASAGRAVAVGAERVVTVVDAVGNVAAARGEHPAVDALHLGAGSVGHAAGAGLRAGRVGALDVVALVDAAGGSAGAGRAERARAIAEAAGTRSGNTNGHIINPEGGVIAEPVLVAQELDADGL